MKEVFIDIETRSSVDLSSYGLYKYAESDDFKILLLSYKIVSDKDKAEETVTLDLTDTTTDTSCIRELIDDAGVLKHAYNAAFEFYCLYMAGFVVTEDLRASLNSWQCDQTHVVYAGWPRSLDGAGSSMGLPEDEKKMAAGKALIRCFCSPDRKGKFTSPSQEPDKWQLFKTYNGQDVDTEYETYKAVKNIEVPENEWSRWRDDVMMNISGVRIDKELVTQALDLNGREKNRLSMRASELTGLVSPNSNSQLLSWLKSQGCSLTDLTKETVSAALELEGVLEPNIREVLQIHQRLAKSSNSKYDTMANAVKCNGRISGISQFYGAARTGRFAGRVIQPQNLPHATLPEIQTARELLRQGDMGMLKALYGENIADTLSALIRTMLVPDAGSKFVVADYSAIEARVIAYVAGEEWVNKVFAGDGKIYEATASTMFNVPIDRIKKGNPEYALRAKGKVATLALGYEGGVNSLIAMGALKQGISESELPELVDRWRKSNPHICALWKRVNQAALDALHVGRSILPLPQDGQLRFNLETYEGHAYLTIQLPGGRKLYYCGPKIKQGKFGIGEITYMEASASGKWQESHTYGGKLVENIIQAIARDCLCEALDRVNRLKHVHPVFHVHDEIITETDDMGFCPEDLVALMCEPIPWAPGLILKAAGFEDYFYRKD